MALEKNIFARTYPQNVNAVGDTLNLWVSSSQTGSGYYQKWVAKGITIPSFGANGDISEILEQVDKVGFKFKDHVDGLTRIDIVEQAQAETSAANSCLKSRIQAEQEAWWDSPYPHYASYVYDDDEGTGPFPGDGKWWFIPTGSALGGYSFQIQNSGKITAYCTCSSGVDGYPEMSEPNNEGYFVAEVGERLAYPQHFFFQFKEDVPIPKGPVAGAFDSSSAIQSVVLYPGIAENFYFSDFNVTSNNTEDNRSSKIFLAVDRLGSDAQPTNIAYISESLVPNLRFSKPEDVFANIQDSNYETSAWTIPRYEGAKSTSPTGELPSAITFIKFSGSVYPIASISESIENENSFEGRKVETLHYYKEYDPNASYTGGGSGGTTTYIRVIDESIGSTSSPSGCTDPALLRRTKAIMIDGTGAITDNTSGNTLEVSVRYLLNHAFGTGEINPDIVIADGAQSGSYEYTSSYQTIPFGETQCRDINTKYGEPNVTSVVGDDGKTYRVVNASFVPPSEFISVGSGINYILKNKTKGSGLNIIQNAFVLNTAKKEIYQINEDGLIIATKQL